MATQTNGSAHQVSDRTKLVLALPVSLKTWLAAYADEHGATMTFVIHRLLQRECRRHQARQGGEDVTTILDHDLL